jgi:hypothetical protein
MIANADTFILKESAKTMKSIKHCAASSIVQLTTHGELLIASTLTRAVVCNTGQKTFREVGSKRTQGGQGVAILGDQIWAARPGCRIWEVDPDTGSVLSTQQFRKALSELAPDTNHQLELWKEWVWR